MLILRFTCDCLILHSPPTAQKMRKSQCESAAGGGGNARFSGGFRCFWGRKRPGRGLTRGFSELFSAVLWAYLGFPKKGGEAGTEITGCCRRGVRQACGPRLAAAFRGPKSCVYLCLNRNICTCAYCFLRRKSPLPNGDITALQTASDFLVLLHPNCDKHCSPHCTTSSRSGSL